MERTYVVENDAARQRLKALVSSLSDREASHPLGHGGWTVTVALAHLAFWDRLWLAKFEEWQRTGKVVMPPANSDGNPDAMNDAMLRWWQSISPAQARHEVLAAAEAIDTVAARLPEPICEDILRIRPRTLIRAVHRTEHLGQIDAALSR